MRDWIKLRVGDHIDFLSGFPFLSSYFGSENGMPLIRIRDLATSAIGTRYGGPYDAKWLVKNGDILIGMDGDFSVVRWRNSDALLNQRILKVDSKRGGNLDRNFYFYWCVPELSRIHSRTAATTVKHLSVRDLEKATGFFPPVEEQQRIAEILSTVDEAIEQTEALIAKTQQIKAALMHDLFTRGVTADGQLRPPREEAPQLYKESPLGWIPKEWGTPLLDDVAARGSGHTPSRNHPEYWNGNIKWVSLADSWRLDRVHIDDTDHRISQAGIANSSAVLHPAGIVVLSRDAGVGKSAVTACAMAVSQHFMCWKCGPGLYNYYLYYWLQYRKWEFENIATGSTIPTIGLAFFRRYRITVPVEMTEQKAIAHSLLAVDEHSFMLEEELGKLRSLRFGLMQDLLAGRVSVATCAS